jgi:serine/threonine-protein kinase
LLDGLDLEKIIKRFGAIPPARAIHFLQQACDSLGEAHVRGLVHRDLKPSNLFACRMGLEVDFVKVLDFGLVKNEAARRGEEDVRLTAVGSISGTPAFMAPEMIEGNAVGPASDVYALGCVAYWLLTGKFVFQATNATAMLVKHLQQPPVAPSVVSQQPIEPKLDQLILDCLAKDPAARPANAVELGRRLGGCEETSQWTQDMAQRWWAEHMFPAPEATGETPAPRTDTTLSASNAFLDQEGVLEGTTN